jgi:serine/threonine protein kinase
MRLWTPNQKLKNGKFLIQKVLGGGGFGVTYSALDTTKEKVVVIKTLNQYQQSQEDFEERQEKFLNEALRLARCTHPHVVKVFEVFQESGLWGMVMEYIDGDDLSDYVEQRGALSEAEALSYIDQIGQALEYVHEQGFLHRDVKPNNILLRRGTQEVVLIDFGLAREFIGKTGSMTNSKTEGYAPPEQYQRRGEFGHYTDVYALAATLFCLLTNEVPIPANFRKKGFSLLPPQQFNPQISDRLNEAIMVGMEMEYQKRPQSIAEFLQLLGLRSPDFSPQIISQQGINYAQLRDLLTEGKWREADLETAKIILILTQREQEGWLGLEHIEEIPCDDLLIIDHLWVKHSRGRFGFSVQSRIYESLGGNQEYNYEIWDAFGDRLGWRRARDWVDYNHITFDISAPEGHLPRGGVSVGEWGGLVLWVGLTGVFNRMKICQIS